MFDVITQAAVLILCGVLWQYTRPMGIDPQTARRVITGLVYLLLLPALVLSVMWKATLGIETLQIVFLAFFGLFSALFLAWAIYKKLSIARASLGAMLLAATFPNATYLGLPVLEAALGPWAKSVAIQYDLLACTPFLLTVGILLARHYGTSEEKNNPIVDLLKVPPLWAAIIGVFLNISGIQPSDWTSNLLNTMSSGVIPLMLIALGLGLSWPKHWQTYSKIMLPALTIQLLLAPLMVWGLGYNLGIENELLTAIVLEAAMPCMVIGIVLCDRFNLNTELYATTVTVSTILAIVSLPLWHSLVASTS